MEPMLHGAAHDVALAAQAIAILIVAIGSVRALGGLVGTALGPHRRHVERRVVSLDFGHWLSAALTFQRAADVVRVSFSPTWDELGRLAAVASIRTFRSYFPDDEVENTRRLQSTGGVAGMRADSPPLGG